MVFKISRRNFLKSSSVATFAFALPGLPKIETVPQFDLILKNAHILDGTGNPARDADIGILGDTIAATGSISPQRGRRVIDVSGNVVTPGFIDMHSHSDSSILAYPGAESRVHQGITTEVTGNCGSSVAPLQGKYSDEHRQSLGEEIGEPVKWTDVASYFSYLETIKISVNHALLLGQGTLRSDQFGMVDRPLTTVELKRLLHTVEIGMEHGAFGISTGLEYPPGQFTPTEEIIAIARMVARYNGLYASHIRNEEVALLAAINEALDVGRSANVKVEISHLKAAGKPNWNKQQAALELIESARRDGLDVHADAYPYTAYSTGITIFLEPWVLAGGAKQTLARLKESQQREKIRKAVAGRIKRDPGGPELIVISDVRSEKNRQLIGKDLQQIANQRNCDSAEAILQLIEEEKTQVSFIGHGMSEKNVEMVLTNGLVMLGSDGQSIAPTGRAGRSRPHPRSYGAFARMLDYYVRERKLLDLPTAIKKMTGMAADHAGIRDWGRIAPGKKADILVFNPAKVKDNATFASPHQFASGFKLVLVNGKIVIQDDVHTEVKAGKILRRW